MQYLSFYNWFIERVGILALFLIIKEKILVFHFYNDVSCGFFIYDLYYVEIGSLYATF